MEMSARRRREVKVIVVSADATPGKIERLRVAGADGYIAKPTEVQDVLDLLDSVAAATYGDGP